VITLPPDADVRTFTDAYGTFWRVHERDAPGVYGARGPRVLVFESVSTLRPVWTYPADWCSLGDPELETLSMAR
jgi:hypothetical protein